MWCYPTLAAKTRTRRGWGIQSSLRLRNAHLCVDFATNHHLLRLVVEGDFLTGADGGDVHAEGDGVMVAGFDGSAGCLARADTLNPFAHVSRGLRIAAGVGFGGDSLRLL